MYHNDLEDVVTAGKEDNIVETVAEVITVVGDVVTDVEEAEIEVEEDHAVEETRSHNFRLPPLSRLGSPVSEVSHL